MVADAEVVKVLVEILSDLKLGAFEVKLNHRGLLDAMLEIAGGLVVGGWWSPWRLRGALLAIAGEAGRTHVHQAVDASW